MHPYDNNTNAGQPIQPQGQPYLPPAPATWPVQGVEPVDQATAPKRGRKTAARIAAVVALVMVLCCTGAVMLGLASSGDEQPVKTGAASNAPATTTPASTTPAEPVAPQTTEPEPAPTSNTMGLPLGTTITATDSDGAVEITVSKSRKYPKARTSGCKSYSPKPDEGFYLVLDVKVEVTTGDASINPLYFTFVDADGGTADMFGAILSGCGNSLKSGNHFPAGTKRSGQLVFNVATAKGEVIFTPNLIAGPAASWQIG